MQYESKTNYGRKIRKIPTNILLTDPASSLRPPLHASVLQLINLTLFPAKIQYLKNLF